MTSLKARASAAWLELNRRTGRALKRLGRRPGGPPAHRLGLEEHHAQIQQASRDLQGITRKLESQFLATGSELEELSRLAHSFVHEIEKLVGMATGQSADDAVFKNAIKLIEQPMEFLVLCHHQTARTLENLRSYNQHIEQLLRTEADLQQTMAPLRFVQTLFKVESAPLGAEVQQMFGSLTQEIERFHTQVAEIFGTKFKQLEQTHRSISGVIAKLEPQARSLEHITTTQKAHIEESLQHLQQELATNQERDVRLSQLGSQIAGEVEQVVFGLQFADIMNQKLQHVSVSLPQIEASLLRLKSEPHGAAAQEQLAFLHQSCRLEAGQLQAVRDDLAKAQSTIRNGIEQVRNHVKKLDSACLSLDEFSLLTTSFDGMVQVLVETIEQLRDLVATTAANSAEVYELLRPMGSLASDLTGVVRGLSSRIHLIGLNAQVQAAHVGRGVGLEVLSARTSEISQETNRISQQAATQLDDLAQGLAESVNAFEQLRAQGIAHQQSLNRTDRTEEAQLHAFRDDALNILHAIGELMKGIEQQSEQSLGTVHYQEACDALIANLQTPLQALAESVARLGGLENAPTASRIEDFKRDYTMASERHVFEKTLAAKEPSQDLTQPNIQTADNDGVLLFDAAGPTSVSAQETARTPNDAPSPGPVQAADPAPATLAMAAAATTSAGGLGDNVELF